jgi:hypothetical protein
MWKSDLPSIILIGALFILKDAYFTNSFILIPFIILNALLTGTFIHEEVV